MIVRHWLALGIGFLLQAALAQARADEPIEPSRPAAADPSPPDDSPGQAAGTAGERLFNGRDLTGWWTPGNLDSWRVDRGELVCINQGGNYLRTEREFGDFELTLEYRAAPHCNSGIAIRTPRDGWPSGDGIELQIYDQPGLDKHSTMALYGNVEPLARADRSNEWNRVVIRAEGARVRAWMNDSLVQDADTSRLPELKHRRRRGWIGFQDHGGAIRFREIRLRELPADPSRAAEADAASAAPSDDLPLTALLDRLLNSQRLAQDDGIGCELRSGRFEAGETTSITMPGPGALVGCFSTDLSGEAAIAFDGEAAPRIRCPAGELHQHLPRFSDDPMPMVTCAPFARELRVTFQPSSSGEYRLAFATRLQPGGAAASGLPTFTTALASLPRGFQPAIEYRLHQFDGGTHREHDPYPRLGGQLGDLAPGEARELLATSGPGVALWLKLLTAPELGDRLANDDLWLSVFVDGEREPSIEAPARHLFPGANLGTNYPNHVVVIRGGPTSFLAMPFADGLRVVARNRGSQTATGIGAVVSVAPLDGGVAARSLGRLRGSFLDGGSRRLISIAGSGRLVSMTLADAADPSGQPAVGAKSAEAAAAQVRIDGVYVDAVQRPFDRGASLASFFGGLPGEIEYRRAASGRAGGIWWRHLLLDAIPFEQSLEVRLADDRPLGPRLALFYSRRASQ